MCPSIFLELPNGDFVVGFGAISFSGSRSLRSPSFFLADFFLETPTPWVQVEKVETISREELYQYFSTKTESAGEITWHDPACGKFVKDFDETKALIKRGEIDKAVLILSQEGLIPSAWEHEVFAIIACRLLESNTSGLTCFGVNLGERGIIGATPELIFKRDGSLVTTTALAGTQKNDLLLENAKDLKEQQLVVKDLVDQLTALGEVTVQNGEKVNFGALSHIRSEIRCDLIEDFDLQNVLAKIHPSAAVGVYPRSNNANLFLKSLHSNLDYFAAPLGLVIDEQSAFAVAMIRSIQWSGLKAIITSGCGVIAESSLESELAELALKRDSVKTRVQGSSYCEK